MIKVSILFVVLLINGCGSSSTTVESKPSLNEENILSVTNSSTVLDEESFVGGVAENEVVIPIASTGEKKEEVAVITIPAGTQFTNESGDVIEKAPVLQVTQRESSNTSENSQESKTTNVVKGEIKFTDEAGNKIIPTEPVAITMVAPMGSKPGDEVRVEVPDGVDKASGQQKLTLFIVDKNGNIRVIVAPHVFESLDVVVIIIERVVVSVIVQPLTGAEGGN